MEERFKFELELTEEQVKEVEKALQHHQFRYYRDTVGRSDSTKEKALNKYSLMEDVLNQFNEFILKHNLV
jgi:hypothetical protein